MVAYCDHDNNYPRTIKQLAERHRAERVLAPVNTARVMTPGETLLTGLPGIGLERAQALLADRIPAHALAYLTWTEDVYREVDQVTGIGPGIKANVRRALGLRDDETLELMSANAPTVTVYTQKEQSNGNGNGSQAAVEPNRLADNRSGGPHDEGLQTLWGEHRGASRGDYGQRL
jgi:hypothetical protein